MVMVSVFSTVKVGLKWKVINYGFNFILIVNVYIFCVCVFKIKSVKCV